tara:strand:+ start:252 stop:650 length:399 start_codon:yes stop_codon:yes gene_type:complete
MNTHQVRKNQYCKNWREVLEELPFEIQSIIRKFVLWDQRNEQRGKRNYLNEWDFPHSVIKCDKCREYIGNKTIKAHNPKYIIIWYKTIYGEIRKNIDTIEATYCYRCVKDYPDLIKCIYTLPNCYYTRDSDE